LLYRVHLALILVWILVMIGTDCTCNCKSNYHHRYPICGPPFFNSSLLWDVFIINSVKQLQTWPKTQSEIDISPFLKTQKPSILYSIIFSILYSIIKKGGSTNRVPMHRPSYIYNVSIFMSISIKYLKEMKYKRTMK
jgi:hypothetical protein